MYGVYSMYITNFQPGDFNLAKKVGKHRKLSSEQINHCEVIYITQLLLSINLREDQIRCFFLRTIYYLLAGRVGYQFLKENTRINYH
jgi:hypothetical protein